MEREQRVKSGKETRNAIGKTRKYTRKKESEEVRVRFQEETEQSCEHPSSIKLFSYQISHAQDVFLERPLCRRIEEKVHQCGQFSFLLGGKAETWLIESEKEGTKSRG